MNGSPPQRITWFDRINVYLLETPRGPVLVDSACPGMLRPLTRRLRRIGLEPGDLSAVVVTHCHIDHIGTALGLADLGVPVFALAEEVPILLGEAPRPNYTGFVGRCLHVAEGLSVGHRTFRQVGELSAGENLFDSPWRIVAAPGHTPGSLALFDEESRDLISGDTLVSDYGTPRGADRLYAADHPRAQASALALLDLEPTAIHPGHGRPLPAPAYSRAREQLRRSRSVAG